MFLKNPGPDMLREWVSRSEVNKLAQLWTEKSRTRWQAEVEEQAKEPQVCGNEASHGNLSAEA